MPRFRSIVTLFVAALAATVSGSGPLPSENHETNLKLLREWQSGDPARYDKIVRNFERFRAMSAEQQERLRALDQQLHDEDSATQTRLMHALEEYVSWLTKLPKEDRERVVSASNASERLRIIRELKEKQWFEQLPLVHREQWNQASEDDRKKLVQQWKQEEQRRKEDRTDQRRWEVVAHERPFQAMADERFRAELVDFVKVRLGPMLSFDEKNRLKAAQTEQRRGPMPWLPWMRAVADLSDQHPVLSLEPRYGRKDLPAEYQRILENPPAPASNKEAVAKLPEGAWPEYAIEVTKLLRSWNLPMRTQLGPSTAKEISSRVDEFVRGPLQKELTASEKQRLSRAEGKWPEYPRILHELARQHKLSIPDLSPPGEPSLWNSVRSFQMRRLPDPPADRLRIFAMEFNRERSGVPLSPDDPVSREYLKRKFFEKYPELLSQLEKQEQKRGDRKRRPSTRP